MCYFRECWPCLREIWAQLAPAVSTQLGPPLRVISNTWCTINNPQNYGVLHQKDTPLAVSWVCHKALVNIKGKPSCLWTGKWKPAKTPIGQSLHPFTAAQIRSWAKNVICIKLQTRKCKPARPQSSKIYNHSELFQPGHEPRCALYNTLEPGSENLQRLPSNKAYSHS